MRKLFILAPLLVALVLLIEPTSDYLNRQPRINPGSVTSSYNPNALFGEFHGKKADVPLITRISNILPSTNTDVLSSKSQQNKEKRIEIDLSKQKLYAYSGGKKVYSFLVSTGKWGRTPTGEFKIWTKLEYTLMMGGSKALNTYYYLPNVPYTMYFYNGEVPKSRGYGIHGAYWHNNFGHPMSHGCVNMKIEDAQKLYDWASAEGNGNSGTKIVIYGTAPNS